MPAPSAPDLVTARAEPAADRRGLERLALWCNRFTPVCAVDAVDGDDEDDGDGAGAGAGHGLLLDITGCAHLFGGEAALMDEIAARLAGLGVENRLGLADTPGAAWALARFGAAETRTRAPGEAHTAIAGLPVEALRLAAEDAHLLRRLGLTTIGAVDGLPRASLARRFPCRERGGAVLARLDRALGRQAEPLVPLVPPPACLERLALPEPLIDRTGWTRALARLMPGLTASLERDGLGVRRLALWCYRVDGGVVRRTVATARATRDGDHLERLFRETLETVDPGFGIDCAALHAERVEPLAPAQLSLTGERRRQGGVDLLVDRLRARLGAGAVCRLAPVARHRPETGGAGGGPRPGARALVRSVRGARKAPAALPPVRPARAGGRDGRGAGRPAAALHLAPRAPPRHARRRARAHRAGMVGRRRRWRPGRGGARLLPHRGRGRPALLALPRRPLRRGRAPGPRPAGTCTGSMDDARVPARHGAPRGLRRAAGGEQLQLPARRLPRRRAGGTRAAELGLAAIGIADRNTLAGAVRAHVAAKAAGLRLLTGARLDLACGLSLLCYPRDRAAYGRLCRLLTLGQRRTTKGGCVLHRDDVTAHAEGQVLIALPPAHPDDEAFAAALGRDCAGATKARSTSPPTCSTGATTGAASTASRRWPNATGCRSSPPTTSTTTRPSAGPCRTC